MHKATLIAIALLSTQGCALAHTAEPEPSCWTTGTVTEAVDRDRCWPTFAECTEDAIRWGGGPYACEGASP